MSFASRLKAARDKAGLSQAQLASQLGVSPGTVGGWEKGTHRIRIATLARLARLFGMKPSQLLSVNDEAAGV